MEKALEEFQDSEPSLEYRLWHVCANRIATSILMKQTAYQVSPFEQSRSYWADSHWSVCLLLVKQPVIGQKLLYLLMIWREGINAVHFLFVSGLDQGEDQATAGELLPAGLG